MEVNNARNQRPRKVIIMVGLCCIYWKYTGNKGWCNGGLAFRQCRLFSKLYSKAYPIWLSLLLLYSTLLPKVFARLFFILILSFLEYCFVERSLHVQFAISCKLKQHASFLHQLQTCWKTMLSKRRKKTSSITFITFSFFSFQFSLAFLSTLDLVTQ